MIGSCEESPYQLSRTTRRLSWTDASVLQVAGCGVATALVGIPNRYMHYQTEMAIRRRDNAVKLIAETILSIVPGGRSTRCEDCGPRGTMGAIGSNLYSDTHRHGL